MRCGSNPWMQLAAQAFAVFAGGSPSETVFSLLGVIMYQACVWLWVSREYFGSSPARGSMDASLAFTHFDFWFQTLVNLGEGWRCYQGFHETDKWVAVPLDLCFHPHW